MKSYRTEDGTTISGKDDNEIVAAMMEESQAWQPSSNVSEFMETFAARSEVQSGTKIRTDSKENFVADLIKAGILK